MSSTFHVPLAHLKRACCPLTVASGTMTSFSARRPMVISGLSRTIISPTYSGAFEAYVVSSACAPGVNCVVEFRPGGGPGSRRSRGT
jgi:hypothetical protein